MSESNVGTGLRSRGGRLAAIACALVCIGSTGCGSTTTADAGVDAATTDLPMGGDGAVGGPVVGAADTHCAGGPDGGLMTQTTSIPSCFVNDGGTPDPDASTGPQYGDTMFGTVGNDDDCKYHLVWSSTPITQNHNVTFTVTVTSLAQPGAPVTNTGFPAADLTYPVVVTEVFLNATHPSPNSNPMTTGTTPGTYTIGPILFDAPGMWTVRFHIHELCADILSDSPHGHAAFYVNVP